MKKFLLILTLFIATSQLSFGQNVNVTFNVLNPDSTPVFVFGSWSGWGNFPGTAMTSLGNGYYSATVPMSQSTAHEYLFVSGTATESLDPTWPCTNGNAQYTNRTLGLGTTDTTVCYVWDSCTTCTAPVAGVQNVTFSVANPDSTPVYVFGSWSGWSNFPGDQMTDPNNDGIYDVTLPLGASANYEYLFVNSQTTEDMNPAFTCTNGNPQYTNRTLALGMADTAVCYKWELCDSCNSTVPSHIEVNFQVQVPPTSTTVSVFGSWSGWTNFPGDAMTSIGNNTYEVALILPSGTPIEYLFVSDTTTESLDETLACTNGNAQYTNRLTNLGTADTNICYQWETCIGCYPVGIQDFSLEDLKLNMGINGVTILSDTYSNFDKIDIYDITGKTVYSSTDVKANSLVDVQLNPATIYLVRVQSDRKISTFKGMIR